MKIYYLRHGETDFNKNYVIQGRIDPPLNELGMAQAEKAAKELEGKGINRAISSPLLRAKMTAEIIGKHLGLNIETDERLLEMNYGDYEGKSRHEECYLLQRQRFAARYPGGESYFDVAKRIYRFLDELPSRFPDETVLLVAHGGISRVVNSYFEPMENEEFILFSPNNCQVLEYDTEKRK